MAIALVRLKSTGKHLSKVYHSVMENKMFLFFLNSVNFNHNVFLKWLHGAHSLATGLWLTGSFRLQSASCHHTWLQSTKMAKTLIRRLHTTVYIDDTWVATLLFYTVYDCGGKIVFLTLFWVVVTSLLKQFFLDWTGVSTTYSYGPLICI